MLGILLGQAPARPTARLAVGLMRGEVAPRMSFALSELGQQQVRVGGAPGAVKVRLTQWICQSAVAVHGIA